MIQYARSSHYYDNVYVSFNSKLAEFQRGFRSQSTCQTKLVQFMHYIICSLDGAVYHFIGNMDFESSTRARRGGGGGEVI